MVGLAKSKLLTPEQKAKRLLLQHLNDEQRWTWRYRGYFDFTGSEGGRFRLVSFKKLAATAGFTVGRPLIEMDENNPRLGRNASANFLCRNIWTNDRTGHYLPEGDNLLAIKVLLEADESMKERACTSVYTKETVRALEGRKRRKVAH